VKYGTPTNHINAHTFLLDVIFKLTITVVTKMRVCEVTADKLKADTFYT
jgi:hypothetical protein